MLNFLLPPAVRKQYAATICVNIITIAHGASCGWPSSALVSLQSDDTPITSRRVSLNEGSTIAALMCVGALVGNFVFGIIGEKIGRKKCICILAIPQFISWMIIVFATEVYQLYASRFCAGLAGGGILLNLPQYVAEISDDKVRGTLSSMLIFNCDVGILLAFIVGNYFPYPVVPVIHCVMPILFVVGFFHFPDTPIHLIKCGKLDAAKESIQFYKNFKSDSPIELASQIEALRGKMGSEESQFRVTWKDFSNRPARKSLAIGFVLICYNQLCGTFALLNYAATIFTASGSNLTPQMSAIVVGVIQLVGAYFAIYLVDKTGRKILLGFSGLGACFGHAAMAAYTYAQTQGYNIDGFTWIPVTSISFVIFIASCGVTTLPLVVIAEIVPPKIRNICVSICMYQLLAMAFLLIKFFPSVAEALGMYGAMMIFAGSTFMGSMFVFFCIPETKGKSFEEINKMLM